MTASPGTFDAMPIYALGEWEPVVDATAYVHPDAVLIGAVTVGAQSTVWPGAVLRGAHVARRRPMQQQPQREHRGVDLVQTHARQPGDGPVAHDGRTEEQTSTGPWVRRTFAGAAALTAAAVLGVTFYWNQEPAPFDVEALATEITGVPATRSSAARSAPARSRSQ